MRILVLLFAAVLGSAPVFGQSDPMGIRDDMPIDTYLALLAQVAPPARDGAEAYMAVFRSRCGRPMRAVELRRAFAEGNGDPTLMAMIRASHEKDTASIQRLGSTIACPRS